jgi:hypothetical protein
LDFSRSHGDFGSGPGCTGSSISFEEVRRV